MCPHTTIYVSSYYYMCPHTTVCMSSYHYMCPYATTTICFLILLYMRPHTTIYVFYICVLILLYMCSHTTIHVSAYFYMRPHTIMYVSSYYYTCASSPCLAPSISLLWMSSTAQFTCFTSTKVQILTQPPHSTWDRHQSVCYGRV